LSTYNGVQQRLVEAGLVLLRDDQDLVVAGGEGWLALEACCGLGLRETVHQRLGVDDVRQVGVLHRAGERHHRFQVGDVLLVKIFLDGLPVSHRVQSGSGDHHRLGLAADLVAGDGPEVLDDDLRLLRQVRRVQRHEPRQRRVRLPLVHLRVVGRA
jgi:hypothetical protein